MLYYIIVYYIKLYYIILYYFILYYIVLYYTILYYTILYCIIVYYITLYYIILCYTILYYTILCFVVLYIMHVLLFVHVGKAFPFFFFMLSFSSSILLLSHKKYFYEYLLFRLFTPLSGYFTIESASGRIQSAVSSIDYEEYTSFNITVMATDNGSPPRSIRKTTKIQVVDVNHPPTDLTFNGRSVSKIFCLFLDHEGMVQ